MGIIYLGVVVLFGLLLPFLASRSMQKAARKSESIRAAASAGRPAVPCAMREPELIEWCQDLALARMQMELWRALACCSPTCDTLVEWGTAEDRVKTLEKCVKEMAQP